MKLSEMTKAQLYDALDIAILALCSQSKTLSEIDKEFDYWKEFIEETVTWQQCQLEEQVDET